MGAWNTLRGEKLRKNDICGEKLSLGDMGFIFGMGVKYGQVGLLQVMGCEGR